MKIYSFISLILISFSSIAFSNDYQLCKEKEILSLVNKFTINSDHYFKDETKENGYKIVWQGKKVRLIVTESGYLRIYPLRPLKQLSELTDDEKLEMESTATKLSLVFQEALNSRDSLRLIPIGKSAGQIGENLYMQVIPSGEQEEGTVDILDKMVATAYATQRGINYDGLSPEAIEKISRIADPILSQKDFNIPEVDINLTDRKYKNGVSGIQFLATLILRQIAEGKRIYLSEEDPQQEEAPPKKKSCCPFRDPEVIQKQLVFESSDNWVLANRQPYMKAHLMTVTKENRNNGSVLSSEEILDKYKLWEKIDAIFKGKFGTSATVILTRCGLGAGQTVNHNHEHILGIDQSEIPFWMVNALLEICGLKTRVGLLDAKEMTHWRELQPLFNK